MIVVSCRGSGGSQGSLYIGFGWFWFAIGHGQSDSATISNLSSYHSHSFTSCFQSTLTSWNSGLPKILIWSIKKWNDWFYSTVLEGKPAPKALCSSQSSSQDLPKICLFGWLCLNELVCYFMPVLDLDFFHLCVVFQPKGAFESSKVQLLNVRHVEGWKCLEGF